MSNSIASTLSAKVWEESEPIPDQSLVEQARKRLDSCLPAMPSVIAVEAQADHAHHPNLCGRTLAVTLLPDGFVARCSILTS